jgi:broad specificity phosphatase PhoE
MTRVLLIHAGPTPWDEENRLTGAHSLPLTPDAVVAARSLIDALAATPPTGLYLCKSNEACRQVGGMLAEGFNLRIRDKPALEEMRLGLWEGLTRDEVRHRFPSVTSQWQDDPLSVLPPGGESLGAVIERVEPTLRKIMRRNRGGEVAIVLRPLAMQVARGLLRGESARQIASHLNNVDVMERIEISE